MIATRPLCALAVGLSLVAVGTAGAATKTKPVCNLVTDPAGDANGFVLTGTPLPSDDNLDILSADIASNTKKVTALVRLKALGTDATAPTGGTIYFNFAFGDEKAYLSAVLDGKGGASFTAGHATGTPAQRHSLGGADGFVDTAAHTVRITAPINMWDTPIAKGTKLSTFDVLAQRFLGTTTTGGATPTADEATSTAVYTAGAVSCVVPK